MVNQAGAPARCRRRSPDDSPVPLKGANVCLGREEASMADLDRFASDGNISCFADQLRYETIPARQEMLKRLLIAELNLFGATQDRLRMVERKITEGADVIARQRSLLQNSSNAANFPCVRGGGAAGAQAGAGLSWVTRSIWSTASATTPNMRWHLTLIAPQIALDVVPARFHSVERIVGHCCCYGSGRYGRHYTEIFLKVKRNNLEYCLENRRMDSKYIASI